MPDGLLAFDDGKLAVTDDGKLIFSVDQSQQEYGHDCCPLVIVVWNSNSQIDDNFDVQLNGTSLGTIDNSTNTCTGRIFATDTTITAGTLAVDANCQTPCNGGANFEATLQLDEDLFIEGSNTLRVQSTLGANNGNFGRVIVGRFLHSNLYVLNKTYVNANYDYDPRGGTNHQDFSFTYP